MTEILKFNKLHASEPKVKYGFTKELLKMGAEQPQLLYHDFDLLIPLLKEENNILKWTGIDLMGYLSAVDAENKTDKQVRQLIQHLHSGQLITCNHAIFALGLIAQNKKAHRKKIIKELLLVEKDDFETSECRNIAIGKVLEVFKQMIPDIILDKEVIDFIRRATRNSRKATMKKGIQLIKLIGQA